MNKKTFQLKKVHLIFLIGLLLFGGFLRFYNLGEGSFWVDELNHVFAGISLSKGDMPVFPSGVPNQRAYLYSQCVGWSFSLFGVSEKTARFPSAIFGILAIGLIYWVGIRWFNSKVGLVAAFLLTFSHPAIGWSRTCRMYTLFQLLFMLGVYFFYRGFEDQVCSSKIRSQSLWSGIRRFFLDRGILIHWLILSCIVFFVAQQVHQLAGLFAVTIIVYLSIMFFGLAVREGIKSAFTSKYFIALMIIGISICVGIVFFHLSVLIDYALSYQPNWAKYSNAADSHYYYWLLTGSDKFPLAAFFLIGSLQAVTRLNKSAVFSMLSFVVPVFMFSFVFLYRVSNYIYNVYPFYLLIVSYGLVNLYDSEIINAQYIKDKLGKWKERVSLQGVKIFTLVFLITWVPLTVWFRVAVKIPFIGSSGNNGAITYNDWRGATNYIQVEKKVGDIVVSTLPLTTLYYLGNVDYNLNLINLDESLNWMTKAKNGRHYGFYTGVPSIESVHDLQKVMLEHHRGWIIADRYCFDRRQCVSTELSTYIKTHLQEVWTDKNHTMVVYFWSS